MDIKMMIKRHDQHLKVLDALFEYNNVHGNLQTYKKQYLERGIARQSMMSTRYFWQRAMIQGTLSR